MIFACFILAAVLIAVTAILIAEIAIGVEKRQGRKAGLSTYFLLLPCGTLVVWPAIKWLIAYLIGSTTCRMGGVQLKLPRLTAQRF